jgi:hypothetical protein
VDTAAGGGGSSAAAEIENNEEQRANTESESKRIVETSNAPPIKQAIGQLSIPRHSPVSARFATSTPARRGRSFTNRVARCGGRGTRRELRRSDLPEAPAPCSRPR